MKKALVLGAGGFIGGHLVNRLKSQGFLVRGVDIKPHEYQRTLADEFLVMDLRDLSNVQTALNISGGFDQIYQLAADMGGAGYIFSGENDANVMHNSSLINLHVASEATRLDKAPRLFYSSSACIYPEHNQMDPTNPNCEESSAYPANPDSEYGWEKLFSERMYLAFHRNYGLDVRIARFHNIFGPMGSWNNGKEKAPAAICRKVAEAQDGGQIEIWGTGEQTRSFLYIDECLDGVQALMESDCSEPVNIGSDEMVSINGLVDMTSRIGGKTLVKKHIAGPIGVMGRTSDNTLIEKAIGWRPSQSLKTGLEKTYKWINEMVVTS